MSIGSRTSRLDPADEPTALVAPWRSMIEALDAAGTTVADLVGHVPDIDIAEGFRYVLNVFADQLDRSALRDTAHPLFLPGVTPVRKLFFDNPDTTYDTALITSARTYRIHGQQGTPTYLAFCVYSGNLAKGEATRVANLADDDLVFEPDGSFEVTLSAVEHPGNWIPLEAGAHTVIARQYFLDRATERPAHYVIEAIDGGQPDPLLGPARFARLALDTARFVTTATTVANHRAEQGGLAANRFVEVAGHGVYGTPDAGYVVCWYRLGSDEALVIEVVPPSCRYWGVHLANRWGQSLDHRTRTTTLNAHTAQVGPDGSLRVVVAPAPAAPGEPNWLDTAGHAEGWVLFRWLLSSSVVVPEAQVVKRTALREA